MFLIVFSPSGVASVTMGAGALFFGILGILVAVAALWLVVFLVIIPLATVLCAIGSGPVAGWHLRSLVTGLFRASVWLLPFAAALVGLAFYVDAALSANFVPDEESRIWFVIGVCIAGVGVTFAVVAFLRNSWRVGKAAGSTLAAWITKHPERGSFAYCNTMTYLVLAPLAIGSLILGGAPLFAPPGIDLIFNTLVIGLGLYNLFFGFALVKALRASLPDNPDNLPAALLQLARARFAPEDDPTGAVTPRAAYAALAVAPFLFVLPGLAGVAGGTWALRNSGGTYEKWHFRNISSVCFRGGLVVVMLLASYLTFVASVAGNMGYVSLVPLTVTAVIALGIARDLRLGANALDRVPLME